MNIWAAASAILGVAVAAFASVFAKMVYKELRDAQKRPTQLPLPPMAPVVKQPDHEDEHIHAGV
jgi:hypothetical protein